MMSSRCDFRRRHVAGEQVAVATFVVADTHMPERIHHALIEQNVVRDHQILDKLRIRLRKGPHYRLCLHCARWFRGSKSHHAVHGLAMPEKTGQSKMNGSSVIKAAAAKKPVISSQLPVWAARTPTAASFLRFMASLLLARMY